MQEQPRCVEEYHAALKRESELWEQVKGHGPGMPGFDIDLWQGWLDAVARTTAASKALRETYSTSQVGDLAD